MEMDWQLKRNLYSFDMKDRLGWKELIYAFRFLEELG